MTDRSFGYFVILAGMRTGSNLLEEQLSAYPGIETYGEMFNPHFFGRPGVTSQFGLSMKARESDPVRVIGAMRTHARGFPGFRLFYDHDRRAIDHVLRDRRAAKIVLTRRPVDSYISLLVARKTGQWWLGDLTTARAAKVAFDPEGYAEFLTTLAGFQNHVARSLQVSGQTAFHIAYDDLADHDIIDGLAAYLGLDSTPDRSLVRAKVQNPAPLTDRLTNPELALRTLSETAATDIEQVPMHEPGRGPGLRLFRAGETIPLLYMPIRGAGFDPVPAWLKSVDPGGNVVAGMTQKDLRRWKRTHPGHRSFTVVRHPLPRAYDSFCRFVLPTDEPNYSDLRAALRDHYEIPLPPVWPSPGWSASDQATAFLAFLEFLNGNLGGQTSLRVDNTWATQDTLLTAIAELVVPDRVLRDDDLAAGLGGIAAQVGLVTDTGVSGFAVPTKFALGDIRNKAIDDAAEAAYRRDYMMFGFGPWVAPT